MNENFTKNKSIYSLLVLYLVTAIAVSYTAFTESQLFPYGKGDNTIESPYLAIYSLSITLFVVAALLTVWRPRYALFIALIAALVAWLRYLGFLWAFAIYSFVPIFIMQVFLGMFLPSVLLFFTTSFTIWSVKSREETYNPIRWLISVNSVSRFLFLITIVMFGLIILADPITTEIQTHEMTWQVARPYDSPCRERVDFKFIETPVYWVTACSDNLLDYLELQVDEPVPVTFEVDYIFNTRRDFRILEVGDWAGELEESPFMQYRCNGNELNCNDPHRSPLNKKD